MTPNDLRAWRERLGWTQEIAAARLGVKKRAYQYWESHQEGRGPRTPNMLRLACERLEGQHRGNVEMRISLGKGGDGEKSR